MKLREAHRLLKGAELSQERKIALVCSFEPLHLATLMQAYAVERSRDPAPEVVTFGYDSLMRALGETSTTLAMAPALLALTWEDLHPTLSWRTRGQFGAVTVDELTETAASLFDHLSGWIAAREGAETYVITPPLEWMPWVDPEPPAALGPVRARAAALLAQGVADLQTAGARVLTVPGIELSLRDLLLAGSPVSADGADRMARAFADAALPLGERKKVLVLDADGTLWKGVLGEVGPEGIECESDGQGWPYHAFQKFLLKLRHEGTILALCSKNDLDDVKSAFDVKEMPLAWDDFAAHRVSWDSKPAHLRSLAQELNIGLDAFVFVDDNEAEIALVGHELPAVTTVVIPKEVGGWPQVFDELQGLCSTWEVTSEDRVRSDMLRIRRPSPPPAPGASGSASWAHLSGFDLRVSFNDDAFDDPRSLQLINKTNQFNLTGERIAPQDWLSLRDAAGSFCCSTRLSDRFGDFGTIAVAVGERRSEPELSLRQFVVSCRAFGRGIEHLTLLHLLRQLDAGLVTVPYRDTGRNEPARRFLEEAGSPVASPPSEGHVFTISRETLESAVGRLMEEARPLIAT